MGKDSNAYYIKPQLPIVVLLFIFLAVAIWLDIAIFIQGDTPGIKGWAFTGIAPFFLIIFYRQMFSVKNNKINRIVFFREKESIDISAISKIEERKDILEGKHFMVYLTGQEKPMFDIDTSYLNAEAFEDDMKRRKKLR